jgi:glycosyltransferase involved in cell wall biosynthesis
MPISLINGMASSKRLNNFYMYLKDNSTFSFHNLINEPDKKYSNTKVFHENIEGLNYHKIKYNNKGIFNFFKVIFLNCMYLKNAHNLNLINVLYYSGYPNIINISVILFAKILKYKIVFDIVEDNSTITVFGTHKQRLKNISSLLFFRYIFLLANGIVCISDFLYYKTLKVTKSRIPVILIPPSFNENFFLNTFENQASNNETIIFYGGSFGKKDGINYLLSAFDILAENYNVTLIMTGKGNEMDIKNFMIEWNKLKCKDKIQYKGYVDDSKYYELLMKADIHCMVRINSDFANAGFPFKLAEMLATGKPVIASKVSDITKYLGPKDAFLIEPETTIDIVNAVKYIIDNPKIAKNVGLNGQIIAQKFFSFKKTSNDLISFIQEKL